MDGPRSRMGTGTRRTMAALIPVLCPPEWRELTSTEELITEIDLGLASMPALARRGLTAGLVLYDLAAIFFHGRRARSLEGDAAVRWFRRWASGHGVFGDLAKGARVVVVMAYFELPQVLARMGYTPDEWIAKVKARRLASYAEDIARHERTIFERDPLPLPSQIEAQAGK